MQACISHATLGQFWDRASQLEGLVRTGHEQGLINPAHYDMPLYAACEILTWRRTTPGDGPALSITQSDAAKLSSAFGLSSPLHLLVNSPGARRKHGPFVCHSPKVLPATDSFIAMGGGLFAGTPELLLAQLAWKLDVVDWLLLAYEFCGAYTLSPQMQKGFLPRIPLTSRVQVEALALELGRMQGIGTLRNALPFLADNSRSPRETAVCLALSLPASLGGYGLPMPSLNVQIDFGRVAKEIYGAPYVVCDLYWENPAIDAEYQSDVDHAGAEVKDALRAAALATEGVEMVPIFKSHARPGKTMDALAKQLALKLKINLELGGRAEALCREALQRRLFGHHAHPWPPVE